MITCTLFQKLQITLALRTRAILVVFEKLTVLIYSQLLSKSLDYLCKCRHPLHCSVTYKAIFSIASYHLVRPLNISCHVILIYFVKFLLFESQHIERESSWDATLCLVRSVWARLRYTSLSILWVFDSRNLDSRAVLRVTARERRNAKKAASALGSRTWLSRSLEIICALFSGHSFISGGQFFESSMLF